MIYAKDMGYWPKISSEPLRSTITTYVVIPLKRARNFADTKLLFSIGPLGPSWTRYDYMNGLWMPGLFPQIRRGRLDREGRGGLIPQPWNLTSTDFSPSSHVAFIHISQSALKKLKSLVSLLLVLSSSSIVLARFRTPTITMTSTPVKTTYPYIVIGAGISGLVLASRLSNLLPPSPSSPSTKQILVLEAGFDPSQIDPETILTAKQAPAARTSRHTYQLEIAEKPNLNVRGAVVPVGKAVGGSTTVDAAAWTRGPRSDYDLWSRIFGDEDWSYDRLLPFMRSVKSVAVIEENGVAQDKVQHGYEGPLKAVPLRTLWPARKYPLKESVQKMWEEASGRYLVDCNNGDQNGLTELVEVWVDGKRQLPGRILDLSKVEIRTESLV